VVQKGKMTLGLILYSKILIGQKLKLCNTKPLSNEKLVIKKKAVSFDTRFKKEKPELTALTNEKFYGSAA